VRRHRPNHKAIRAHAANMDREASLLRRPQWVLHTIVGEIEYPQRVKGGLRHASLMGIRPDKRPRLIRRSPLSEPGQFSDFRPDMARR